MIMQSCGEILVFVINARDKPYVVFYDNLLFEEIQPDGAIKIVVCHVLGSTGGGACLVFCFLGALFLFFAFADSVFERFENPFIDHALLSISLNSVSKWEARVLPSFKDYYISS